MWLVPVLVEKELSHDSLCKYIDLICFLSVLYQKVCRRVLKYIVHTILQLDSFHILDGQPKCN